MPVRDGAPPSRDYLGADDLVGQPRLVHGIGGSPRPFRTGLPAVDLFPYNTWARLLNRRVRKSGAALAAYGDSQGLARLRHAVAEYATTARGISCTQQQILITNGAQQAIDLLTTELIQPGERVWLEDPGYPGARRAMEAAGARVVPVPVDGEGISVEEGIRRAPDARLIYVTPSHQYPLGMTMSLPRRLELLSWARDSNAWVVEDDYDSEFRYGSRPIESLRGLSDGQRVLYVGTYSKTMFPSLRLGYLIAPEGLIARLTRSRFCADRHGPLLEQAALADFIADGNFPRHVRRMRVLYQARRDALCHAVAELPQGVLTLGPADGGLHVCAWLSPGVSDQEIARQGLAMRLELAPLSRYCMEPPSRGGLILGFAPFTPGSLRHGIRTLGNILAAR